MMIIFLILTVTPNEALMKPKLQRCDNEQCLAALETRPYLKERKVRKVGQVGQVRKVRQLWHIFEIFCIYYN